MSKRKMKKRLKAQVSDLISIPTITREFGFDSGHRILNHESKCANLHGHRYTALVTCAAKQLDKLGRVIDFSVVKKVVGGWIDDHWDHTMILNREDPLLCCCADGKEMAEMFGPRKPYVMATNPTAENMAAHLYGTASRLLLPYKIRVVRVVLYETPNCFATYPG